MESPENDRLAPLIDEDALARRIPEMAEEIVGSCEGVDELVVIGLLKGAFVFMADLVRAMSRFETRQVLGFMGVGSYGSGTVSSGSVTLTHELGIDVAGRTVVLLDDILDTGRTLRFAKEHLEAAGAARVITAVLLDKPSRREVAIEPDHVGFQVPDRFVVGYGIDFDEQFRDLPYIAAIDSE